MWNFTGLALNFVAYLYTMYSPLHTHIYVLLLFFHYLQGSSFFIFYETNFIRRVTIFLLSAHPSRRCDFNFSISYGKIWEENPAFTDKIRPAFLIGIAALSDFFATLTVLLTNPWIVFLLSECYLTSKLSCETEGI